MLRSPLQLTWDLTKFELVELIVSQFFHSTINIFLEISFSNLSKKKRDNSVLTVELYVHINISDISIKNVSKSLPRSIWYT